MSEVIGRDAQMSPPRVTSLRVRNYRALKDVTLEKMTPLTVLLGPNGSGKSTVFDVFAFLSECLSEGVRRAWDRRGRFKELRSRDAVGPIVIEIKYREKPKTPLITYHLEIDESGGRPVVSREYLSWTRGSGGKPFRFLDYSLGSGVVVTGETPEAEDTRTPRSLSAPDVLAVSTLGTLAENPRVIALREFITSWHLSYLSADAARGNPEAGAEERLSPSGDNLPNVIQFLREQHQDRLDDIFKTLRQRIPRIERIDAEVLADSRLLLLVKDAPFSTPVLSRYVSDGTLKLLAYLTILNDPNPPKLIGIEEPENYLHPRILPELAEECQMASGRTQLIITTHSPFFLDPLKLGEVRVIFRGVDGYTRVRRVEEMAGVSELLEQGAKLGEVWMEGHFDVGDPLEGEAL